MYPCPHQITIRVPMKYWPKYGRFMDVPCGKCEFCRRNHREEWFNRLMMEDSIHPEPTLFLTLTYDDEHLPRADPEEPEYTHRYDAAHLQKFVKRLRKWLSVHYPMSNVRYFAVAEYGKVDLRVHYHMLLFGYPSDDVQFYKHILQHWEYGSVNDSQEIDTPAAINYVAKYCLKPDWLPPYCKPPKQWCSINPPIGWNYVNPYSLRDHLDSRVFVDGHTVSLPKSFKRKVYDAKLYPEASYKHYKKGLEYSKKATEELIQTQLYWHERGQEIFEIKEENLKQKPKL